MGTRESAYCFDKRELLESVSDQIPLGRAPSASCPRGFTEPYTRRAELGDGDSKCDFLLRIRCVHAMGRVTKPTVGPRRWEPTRVGRRV